MNTCMFGAPHPGDAIIVRGKVGNTAGFLCPTHYKQHQKMLSRNGFHFRTFAEMEARGEGEFTDDGREEIDPQLDTQPHGPRADEHLDDSGDDPAGDGLASVAAVAHSMVPGPPRNLDVTDPGRNGGGVPAGRGGAAETQLAERQPDAGAAARRDSAPAVGGIIEPDGNKAIWWAGVGELVLDDWQRDILQSPFDLNLVKWNYNDEHYIPWIHYWKRFLAAFAPSIPQMLPLSEPQIKGDTVSIHYAMLVNGCFVGEAWGEMAKKGNNKVVTFARCCEGCCSDAITRIGKRLGMGLELWDPSTIRELEGRKRSGRTERSAG